MSRLIIIIFAIMGLSIFNGCNAQSAKYKSVEVSEFETVIKDTNILVLDVRTPEEFSAGHINGAVNIDVRNPLFLSKSLQQLPKNRTLAVYCRSGNRSKKASDMLAANGYKIIELNTGILGWTDEGKELVK